MVSGVNVACFVSAVYFRFTVGTDRGLILGKWSFDSRPGSSVCVTNVTSGKALPQRVMHLRVEDASIFL